MRSIETRGRERLRRLAAFLMSVALLLVCVGCGGGHALVAEDNPNAPPSSVPVPEEDRRESGSDASAEQAQESAPEDGRPASAPDEGSSEPPQQPAENGADNPPVSPPPPNDGAPNGPPMGGGPGDGMFVEDLWDEYHVAMVFDTSASMRESDPNNAALLAACMFLDTMFISDSNGENRAGMPSAQVGLFWYNDEAHSQYEDGALQALNVAENVEAVKNTLFNIEPEPGAGDFALPEALNLALDALEKNKTLGSIARNGPGGGPMDAMEGNGLTAIATNGGAGTPEFPNPAAMPSTAESKKEKPLIILFTDGYEGYVGSNSNSDMPYFERRNQPDLEKAVQRANELGAEIYVLGLDVHSNGKIPVPEESAMGDSWSQFMKLANATQQMDGQPQPPDAQGISFLTSPPDMNEMNPPINMSGGLSGVFESNGTNVNYQLCPNLVTLQNAYVQLTAAMVLQGSKAQPMKRAEFPDGHWEHTVTLNEAGKSAVIFYIFAPELRGLSLEHFDKNGELDQEYISYPNEKRHNPLDTSYKFDNVYEMDELGRYKLDKDGNRITKHNWWVKHDYANLPMYKVRCPFYKDCATIAVLEPEPGTWRITSYGKQPQASYLQIGGLDFRMTLTQDESSPQTGIIRLWADVGANGMGEEFYNTILDSYSCTVFLDNGMPEAIGGSPNGGPPADGQQPGGAPQHLYSQNVTLRYEEDDKGLKGTFHAKLPGRYKVEFSINSVEIAYKQKSDFINMIPGKPEEISFRRISEQKTIKPRFTGWPEIPLYVVEVNHDDLLEPTPTEDGRSVQLKSAGAGVGELSMTVEFYSKEIPNGEGNGGYRWDVVYPVRVQDNEASATQVPNPSFKDERASVREIGGGGGGNGVSIKTLLTGIWAIGITLAAIGGIAYAVLTQRRRNS